MAGFKAPDFKERAAMVNEAKQKALDKLRAKPPIDPAVAAERAAAQQAREAAAAEKSQAKRAAQLAEKEARRAKAELAAEAARKPAAPVRSEAELKAARDARYAARKNRKK